MDTNSVWHTWIGLPHELGAEPRLGKGACCLRMAELLHQAAGTPFPDITPLLEQARNQDWGRLQQTFHTLCEVVPEPKPLTMTLVNNGKAGLGIGNIVDDNYMLLPHHKRGVLAIPISILRPMKFYKLKVR